MSATLPRALHPGAWWRWAIGLAAAASTTNNPLLLLLVLAVVALVVARPPRRAPWARAFRLYLWLGLVVVVVRVVCTCSAGSSPARRARSTCPRCRCRRGRPASGSAARSTSRGCSPRLYDGLRLAAMLACVGAANALANPKRLLKAVPGALYEVGVAVVVVADARAAAGRERAAGAPARRLRGAPRRGSRAARGRAARCSRTRSTARWSWPRRWTRAATAAPAAAPRARRAASPARWSSAGCSAMRVGVYGLLDADRPRLARAAAPARRGCSLSAARAVARRPARRAHAATGRTRGAARVADRSAAVWSPPPCSSPSRTAPSEPGDAADPAGRARRCRWPRSLGLLVGALPACLTPPPPRPASRLPQRGGTRGGARRMAEHAMIRFAGVRHPAGTTQPVLRDVDLHRRRGRAVPGRRAHRLGQVDAARRDQRAGAALHRRHAGRPGHGRRPRHPRPPAARPRRRRRRRRPGPAGRLRHRHGRGRAGLRHGAARAARRDDAPAGRGDPRPARPRRAARPPLRTLSGGQQQRVAIGSVLTAHPRVLVLDEPTSALDPTGAEEVLAALTRLVHDLGITVVLAEHRLERVVQYADRVVPCSPAGEVRSGLPGRRDVDSAGRAAGGRARPARRLVARCRCRCATPAAPPAALRARLAADAGPGARPTAGRARAAGPSLALAARDVVVRYGDVARRARGRPRPARRRGRRLMGRNGCRQVHAALGAAGHRRLARTCWLRGRRSAAPRPGTTRRAAHPGCGERRSLVGLVPQTAGDLLYLETVGAECAQADRESAVPSGTRARLLERLAPGIAERAHPRDLSEGQRLALVLAVAARRRPAGGAARRADPRPGLRRPRPPEPGAARAGRRGARRSCWPPTTSSSSPRCADRVVVLADGEVVADGPTPRSWSSSPAFAPQVPRSSRPAVADRRRGRDGARRGGVVRPAHPAR